LGEENERVERISNLLWQKGRLLDDAIVEELNSLNYWMLVAAAGFFHCPANVK